MPGASPFMTCTVDVHDCGEAVNVNLAAVAPDCITCAWGSPQLVG